MVAFNEKKASFAPAYVVGVYPELAAKARSLGYALALHGSLQRDLDLIAVPWTEEADDAHALIAALCEEFDVEPNHNAAVRRPHGRLCWSVPLWWGAYLDISVMPLSKVED
jgi:hypothetical protein